MNQILIKAHTLRGPLRSVVKKNVHLAQREAEDILREARSEAERIANEAEHERMLTLDAARQDGYAAGLAQWNAALVKAWNSYADLLIKGEAELVHLAVSIAKKIIGEELKTNADAMISIVREAVRVARRARMLLIQVNPDYETQVRQKIDSFRSLLAESAAITVIPDPGISPGGCIVESDIGIIDARLETQLTSLEQALLERTKQ